MVYTLKLLITVIVSTLIITVMFEFKMSMLASYTIQNVTSFTDRNINLEHYKELTFTNNYTLTFVQRPWNPTSKRDRLYLNQEPNSIAIGGALRLSPCFRGHMEVFLRQSLFRELLPTFCKTASVDFKYYFIFVYDHSDPCLSGEDSKNLVVQLFNQQVSHMCPANIVQSLELFPCDYSGQPARAQNDAMMAAYWKNITYFFR